jgi:hypothetical protein
VPDPSRLKRQSQHDQSSLDAWYNTVVSENLSLGHYNCYVEGIACRQRREALEQAGWLARTAVTELRRISILA